MSVPTFLEVAVKNARDEFYAETEVQTVKSEAVFRRYSIVETEDLRDGFAKVLAFNANLSGRQDASPPSSLSFGA